MEIERGGWIMIQQNVTDQELEQLDACVSNLYEDLDAKIKSTGIILELAKRMECLAALASHGSALCALGRVLREEGRKSFTLRMNIISIFYIFSFFRNFHQALIAQNAGRATLQVLALEIKITESHAPALTPQSLEKERLLYMSITVLLNLAHNTHIEEKMRKFFLVELLCKALDYTSANLLLITVVFLKKLSIVKENKETMKANGVVPKIVRLLPCENEPLLHAIIGLLRNLSFDSSLKCDMVDFKLLQSLESFLSIPELERMVSGLFYTLSTDAKLRSKFSETDVMPIVLKIILSDTTRSVSKEMLGLAVNLTAVPSIAETLCKPPVMEKLMARAKHDPVVFKIIRNVSQLEDSKSFLLSFIPELVKCFLEGEPAVQVEVMGAFNNMVWFEEISEVLVRKNLLQALSTSVGFFEPDVLLEICSFLGAACSFRTAPIISDAGLVSKLCSKFLEKKRDADLNVQFLYMFSRFLLFDATKKDLLPLFEKMGNYALELMKEPNKAVSKFADIMFNVLMEVDQECGFHLKAMRFAMCKRQKNWE